MSIATRAARGAAWTISTSLITRGLTLIGTLILVRFLAPEEYGVVCAASLVASSASQFSTLGIGIFLIANPRAGRGVTFHATVLNLALIVVALAAALLLGGLLGPLFDAPTFTRYLPGMALSVLIDRIAFVPERVLIRNLSFGPLARARTTGELAYTLFAIGSAMLGFGAWAIVIGNLARSFSRGLLIVTAVDIREWLSPCPIERRTVAAIAGYGVVISMAGLANFAQRRWDNLLMSHYFGPGVMGAYNLAYNLADVPAVQVGEQITDVLQASLVQMEAAERSESLLRWSAILGLLIFPLAVGLGVVAPSVCAVVFVGKWGEVAPMLMILSVLSVPRPIMGALNAYMQAQHRQRSLLYLEVGHLAVLGVAIMITARFGPLAVCGVVGVVFTARALANMWVVRASEGIPIRSFLDRLSAPLAACAPMAAAVLAVPYGFERLGLRAPVARLIVQVVIGGIVYAASARLIARRATLDLFDLVRQARQRRSGTRDATVGGATPAGESDD